ncbi:MAG: AP2 domain-containing protein [Candidatus Sulfotelmatobacter sp.]
MKTLALTQGYVAMVDDHDFGRVSENKWRALVDRRRNKVYAVRKTHGPHSSRKSLYMHREILGVTDPEVKVDHRNGDSLDNRRTNLRKCVGGENNANSVKRQDGRSSKYKGVCWHKRDGKFQASIRVRGRTIFLGTFTDEVQAAQAYDEAARAAFGEFAQCNFPL